MKMKKVLLIVDGSYIAFVCNFRAFKTWQEQYAGMDTCIIRPPEDSDQDNYTQDTAPRDDGRHNGYAICFSDGHGGQTKKYNYAEVTYYTDRMSGWLGDSWTADTNNVVME